MKKVTAVFITDGRIDLLENTLQSFHNNIQYPFFEKIIINDSLDEKVINSVNNLSSFYGIKVIQHEEKRGFAGAYDSAFKNISSESDYTFFCEDDFVFNEKINIGELIYILEYDRNIVQIALKRQAWSEEEKAAGGFMEQWIDQYHNKEAAGLNWCEHRLFYTTNPNLTSKFVIERGWQLLPKSESVFSQLLFMNPNYKSAYLGKKTDSPKVEHVGYNRSIEGQNY
jgi:glycosyltransferase involved in cell wall biosynthesis